MGKIQYHNNRTLKLTNVIKKEVLLEEHMDFHAAIQQMQSYIRTKGAQ